MVTFKFNVEHGKVTLRTLTFKLVAFAGLQFLFWLRLHQPYNTVDDAYITFRYARNLIHGVGFVYNPGERVLGSTTPAYAMLLALTSRASGLADFPRLALFVNLLCDALSFSLLLRLVARLSGRRWVGLIAAWLLALNARLIDFSTGGMESSLNVLMILLTLGLMIEGRTSWAALTAGLAVLIRPDGLTLAAAFFLLLGVEALRRAHGRLDFKQLPWVEVGLFTAVVVPWLIFATLYFGQPIPQSVLAKAEVYRLERWTAFRALLVQLRVLFSFNVPPLSDPESFTAKLIHALFPAALVGLGVWTAQKRNSRAWMLGVYIVFFILFFSIGNPLWLGWYEIPLEPLYPALILIGVVGLAERTPHPVGALRAPVIGALPLITASLLILPQLSRLNALPWETPQHDRFVINSTFNKEREADYRIVAEMLAPAAQNGRQVAIPEIGAFGEVYQGNVFDTTGLISPATLKYFPIPTDIPVGLYTVPKAMIFDLRPDLFITFDNFIEEDLRPDNPDFLQLYTPTIGLTSRANVVNQRLIVYRRADLPLEVVWPADLSRTDMRFDGDRLWLEGYDHQWGATTDYRYLDFTLFWRNGEAALTRDLLARVDLIGADGQTVFQILNFPGDGLFPTRSWAPNMRLIDRYQLKLPTPDAGPYTVNVALFDNTTSESIPAFTSEGTPLRDNTFTAPVTFTEPHAR